MYVITIIVSSDLVQDPEMFIGYLIGCISAAFYVGSRVPQIVKNVRQWGPLHVSMCTSTIGYMYMYSTLFAL